MKTKWKVLKETLESEIKLTDQATRQSVKEKNYGEAFAYSQQRFTVKWVLKEMEIIEETQKELERR